MQENIAKRISQNHIERSFERNFITAIIGPRRVGKSFIVAQYAKAHPNNNWVFLNMDIMEQRLRIARLELATIISEHSKQPMPFTKNKIWVIIDEAQKCPELFDQLKLLYDTYKNQNILKFIVTGSAILDLHKLSAESLAGRIEIIHLYGFNLRESLSLTENNIPMGSLFNILTNNNDQDIEQLLTTYLTQLTPYKPLLEEQLEKHLIWGGFPEIFSLNSIEEKVIYLNNYLQTYLEKDIRAIENITNLTLYHNMMDIIAEQTGSIRDDNKIIQALKCTRDTLKKYRGYLAATLLYMDIYPHITTSLKRLVKSPKSYLLNNGLINILMGITNLQILKKTGQIGHRLENWFLNEINTWAACDPFLSQVYYWRTQTGIEVDFIIVKKPHIYPFEVTMGSNIEGKKIKNLITFLKEEPKAKWGYYVYNGGFAIDHNNKIIFLPIWAIA